MVVLVALVALLGAVGSVVAGVVGVVGSVAEVVVAAAVAAVVADVAAVKYPGFLKEVPACAGTFLYSIRHKGQIVVHRIKVKCCANSST
ncbi:hypothetical protein [Peribacillus sp. CSMR9]|uniref:hypothetical protein n=1 Tax=Peribacillus sp. CSMR9 TaxID=2981350 RepID=UPI002953DBE2|nr:hypothetical protein [Peribacillus sp. CSMR9]MDV7764694.1 hypothetical protein [Peribacillus sp. CSMR9]